MRKSKKDRQHNDQKKKDNNFRSINMVEIVLAP
jgi:hypothetical protein